MIRVLFLLLMCNMHNTSHHTYTTREKKQIIDRINQLSRTEHEEILKLINDTVAPSYTQNRNGIFINFKALPDDLIKQIDDFVHFCFQNKVKLDEYDIRINECKLNNTIDALLDDDNDDNETNNKEVESKPLSTIINKKNYVEGVDQSWIHALKECKQKDKLDNMIEVLENNLQKVHKKKSCNMKFSIAKKKYGRKVLNDKKVESDLFSNLEKEEYLHT